MTIERTRNGGYEISTLIYGHYFRKVYLGYTRKEAITEFHYDLKEYRSQFIIEQRS